MVLVTLSKEALEDAKLLATLAPEVLTEFASIALEHLRVGSISAAKYSKAASALNLSVDALSTAVRALAHILLESARVSAQGEDLVAALEELHLNEEAKQALKQVYSTHSRDLRALLSDLSLRLAHYHNLEWRLDVSLGSRHCRGAVKPSLLLSLETRDAEDRPAGTHMLQMDYANLDHVVQQLEAAVKEVNTKHSRRVLRYVK